MPGCDIVTEEGPQESQWVGMAPTKHYEVKVIWGLATAEGHESAQHVCSLGQYF